MNDDSPSAEAQRSKFYPTAAWGLRQRLDNILVEIEDLHGSLTRCRERKEFDRKNFGFCVDRLVIETRKLKRFYDANK